MRYYCIILLCWVLSNPLRACPLCEKRQPKGFAGITHGTGPESTLDYWILYGAILVVILTLGLFIWSMFRPESRTTRQMKYQFLTDWQHG